MFLQHYVISNRLIQLLIIVALCSCLHVHNNWGVHAARPPCFIFRVFDPVSLQLTQNAGVHADSGSVLCSSLSDAQQPGSGASSNTHTSSRPTAARLPRAVNKAEKVRLTRWVLLSPPHIAAPGFRTSGETSV